MGVMQNSDPSLGRYKTIAKRIGLFGGIATFIAMNSVPFILSYRLKESEHYQQAITLLKTNPEAIRYLGEPIVDGRVNTTKREDYGSDEGKIWINVPVKGPQTKGNLYYEASIKEKEKGIVELSKVELKLNNLPGYKLLIKKPD